MFQLFWEIWNNWELIWALAMKELHVRYKRSALGFLWSLLNPLMTMVILTLVFSTVMASGISHYSIFLISALLPWTFLSQSLSYAVESIVSNSDLLKKIYVPKSVFPVAAIVSNLVNFLLSLIPLALLLVVLRFPFHRTLLLLPIPLAGLVLFALGFGFFCAAANVYFRDVAHILQIVIQAWFYMSPIIYSLDLVPRRFRLLFRLNPMVYILNEFRMSIYWGKLPTAQSVGMSLAVGLVAVFLGYSFFRRVEDSLVYYL
jgi:ABC-type polysaccharide/polyol phosphate export permease